MKKNLYSLLLILCTIISCKKDQQLVFPKTTLKGNDSLQSLSLVEVKDWYNKNVNSASKFNDLNATNLRTIHKAFSLASLSIPWNKIQSVKNKKGNYWVVSIEGQPTFKNVKLGYRKLAFIKDFIGKVQSRILEIIPEGIYLQRIQKVSAANFTGRVFVYDQNYRLLSGEVYSNGKLIGYIKPQLNTPTTTSSSAGSSMFQSDEASIIQNCEWNDSSYIDGDGVFTIYSELDCSTTIHGDGGGGGGSSGGYIGNYSGSTGDTGGAGISSAKAPPVSNLPGETNPPVDPKSLVICFGNVATLGANMTVTIYVQEPFPGTGFNLGPNSVGHTAIGLKKTNGNSSVTQVIGFYPNATGMSKMHAPSKVSMNNAMSYDISVSYSVDAAHFSEILNYVSNPPAVYDLFTFNCTNFIYSACQAGGVTLPNPYSTLGLPGPEGENSAMTPAGLGNSLESQKSNNVNKSGGYTPNSKGPCSNSI